MDAFRFPENFSLGVASAATQVDGDCKNSNWYDWYQKGHIKDGFDPDVATMHRKFLREDTGLMASLGIGHYRFGLEWARIEPREGVFSDEEFDKIREEILLLREKGISVLVTIHHFSNPIWFEEKGGFLCPESLQIFLRLTEKVVEKLGDLISEYITINEPNVYAVSGYMGGDFPPGENNLAKTLKVIKNMGVCHRRAYERIHALRKKMGYTDTKVGFAHHMRAFAPYHAKNPWYRLCSDASEYLFQGQISKSYLLGAAGDKGRYADFLGLNYYSRTASKGFADSTFPGVPVNDLGWESYPQGIVDCCRKLHAILPDLPIYITENGTADNSDAFRTRFLYEHVKALCESGLPVTRYYHWCFVDNFEWLEGFTARFGIVELNTETMERTVKKSGRFYQKMIENRGVTAEMAAAAMEEAYPIGANH
ncbi:Beta-glucosidase [uncultured Eubacteriales bacterium]|uniref:Beta-glucosidase n=1 Tax=uncultured Eubacteriales bacterium TaxID=172733 RepID=A0A212JEC9_9FIRM|nr:Beta-glucosidase [uncultured Eubacteriales bacterium]